MSEQGAEEKLFIYWSDRATFKEQERPFMASESSGNHGDRRITERLGLAGISGGYLVPPLLKQGHVEQVTPVMSEAYSCLAKAL